MNRVYCERQQSRHVNIYQCELMCGIYIALNEYVSMQCVTQYSIVIRRISHEEELFELAGLQRICNLLGEFEYAVD